MFEAKTERGVAKSELCYVQNIASCSNRVVMNALALDAKGKALGGQASGVLVESWVCRLKIEGTIKDE